MGLFDKLLGKQDYPDLDPSHPAAGKLENVQQQLETLVKEIPEPLEVVPAEEAAYVFIGKPPKKFGVAWIENGQIHNFQTLVKEKGVQPFTLQGISEKLREAYERHSSEPRFKASVADRDIVVIPSSPLQAEVEQIIRAIAA